MTPAALEVEGLTVRLGGDPIVRDVSLALHPGQLVAVLGPNGAGKTTWLRAVAGLVAHAGIIRAGGRDLAVMSPQQRARCIGYLPQGHQAHWPLPARDIVALGRYPHGARDPARMSARDAAIVEQAMARTDCARFAAQTVQTLSGGERARVMLARALAVQAPVLLADEPMAALDPRHQLEVMGTLRAEAERGGLVLAVTHDVTLAARFADAVVLMNEGAVVAHGSPAEVLDDARMADVYGVTIARPFVAGSGIVLPWTAV